MRRRRSIVDFVDVDGWEEGAGAWMGNEADDEGAEEENAEEAESGVGTEAVCFDVDAII